MNQSNKGIGRLAIVGGAISGITLSLALRHRGIDSVLYEQSSAFTEIGAGLSILRNASQAIEICSPAVLDAFLQHRTLSTGSGAGPTHAIHYDGRKDVPTDEARPLFSVYKRTGIHRSSFLKSMSQHIPSDCVKVNQRLVSASNLESTPVTLCFEDGTVAEVDSLIACDGIRSSVRSWLFPLCALPQFTGQVAYRGLISASAAQKALGDVLLVESATYLFPGGNLLTYPIANGQLINVLVRCRTSEPWPDCDRLSMKCSKHRMKQDLEDAGETVHKIVDLLEDEMSVWGLFDQGDYPLPKFNTASVCLLGDAAHASTPHLGSGAGMCIEDCAIMAELLADPLVESNGGEGVEAAFEAFNRVKIKRTQEDLVLASRRAGDLVMLADNFPEKDMSDVEREFSRLMRIIWNADIKQHVVNAKAVLAAVLLEKGKTGCCKTIAK